MTPPGGAGPQQAGPQQAGLQQAGLQQAVIALGSNLGDRLGNLQGGLDALFGQPGLEFVTMSPVYETVPAGGPEQADFLNAVLVARTRLPARVVLARCHRVEAAFGRTREVVWGPRTLDLDLIVYGDQVSDDPALMLPHPRAHERAFVLAPWLAVDPDAHLPGWGRADALLAAVGAAGVRRLDGAGLRPPA